jgi:hypothetical protein
MWKIDEIWFTTGFCCHLHYVIQLEDEGNSSRMSLGNKHSSFQSVNITLLFIIKIVEAAFVPGLTSKIPTSYFVIVFILAIFTPCRLRTHISFNYFNASTWKKKNR